MKKLLGILVLGLFLTTPSWADDIRDFQIEGMSIGDSLLDYLSEDEIENRSYPWRDKSKIYKSFHSEKDYNTYDYVMFTYLSDDKNYIIHEVAGRKYLEIKKCYKLQLEIIKEIEQLISNAKKEDRGTLIYRGDKTKKSTVRIVNFLTEDGLIHIGCYDFSDKITKEENFKDSINVSIGSKKFLEFQESDDAF